MRTPGEPPKRRMSCRNLIEYGRSYERHLLRKTDLEFALCLSQAALGAERGRVADAADYRAAAARRVYFADPEAAQAEREAGRTTGAGV